MRRGRPLRRDIGMAARAGPGTDGARAIRPPHIKPLRLHLSADPRDVELLRAEQRPHRRSATRREPGLTSCRRRQRKERKNPNQTHHRCLHPITRRSMTHAAPRTSCPACARCLMCRARSATPQATSAALSPKATSAGRGPRARSGPAHQAPRVPPPSCGAFYQSAPTPFTYAVAAAAAPAARAAAPATAPTPPASPCRAARAPDPVPPQAALAPRPAAHPTRRSAGCRT